MKRLFRTFDKKKTRRAVSKLQEQTVGELMSTLVVSVKPEDTVVYCATKMIAEDISCMVVMDGEELKGILSERDFLTKVPLNKKVFDMLVSDIMTPDVVTVEPDMSLTEAAGLMKKKNFRRLVVAENGRVLGIITQTDFSKALQEAFKVFPIGKGLLVKDIMSRKVLTAKPKETFQTARNKMKKLNVGSIIITENKMPLGIFTEYDVVMQFYDQHGQLRLKQLSNYMRKYVRAASPGLSVFDANQLLITKRMRRLPIVEGEKLAGIVTQTDIIRFIYTNLDKILASLDDGGTEFRKLPDSYGEEFRGDHLKVFG